VLWWVVLDFFVFRFILCGGVFFFCSMGFLYVGGGGGGIGHFEG